MWFGMPVIVADYILEFLRKDPGYWSIYKDALVPEEAFWATTIKNSPFANQINYYDGVGRSLVYRRKSVNNHPPTFTINDIKELEKSNAFFSRKFDIFIDSNVIDYFFKLITSDN